MVRIENTILNKCNFEDECDFCNNPKEGTFCRSSGYEYDDDFYWICGKCFNGFSKKYPKLDEMRLMIKIDRLQEDLPVKLPF